MTGDLDGNEPDNTFARVSRGQRATDFVVLGIAGLITVGGLVILGELTIWAAIFSALIMAAFSVAYFAGAADLRSEAIRAARAAEGDQERSAQAVAERRHRAQLIEALA